MNLIRHGDVLLKPVAEIKGKETYKGNKYIVAYGEVTGHTHTLSTKTKNGLRVFEANGEKYLDVTGNARIKHQEHKELEVMPGKYQVVIEEHYNPFERVMEQVRD